MSSQWHDALELKLATVFTSEKDRNAARDLLSTLSKVNESDRVAMACLKLSGCDLPRLEQIVSGAITDYRDILAWAEYTRQMGLGPSAPPADQARARREDMEEYSRWLKGS